MESEAGPSELCLEVWLDVVGEAADTGTVTSPEIVEAVHSSEPDIAKKAKRVILALSSNAQKFHFALREYSRRGKRPEFHLARDLLEVLEKLRLFNDDQLQVIYRRRIERRMALG